MIGPSRPSRPLIAAAALLALPLAGLVAAGPAPAAPFQVNLPPATRGPVRIAFTPDGKEALVAEADTGTLAVLDRDGKLLKRMPTGGEGPEAVAAESRRTVLVANAWSGSVGRLDLETGEQLGLLRLPGEPVEVVLSADRRRAFVSLARLDQVAVLDLPALTVRERIPVGDRPRAMALAPDGGMLLVANFQGGDVSVVDTASLKEMRRIRTRGVNLRGIQVSPDGEHAFVTGQVPSESRVTWVAMDVWVNTVFRLNLRNEAGGGAGGSAEGRLDAVQAPCPDPDGIAVLAEDRVALTFSGSDEAALVRVDEGSAGYFQAAVERRTGVGAHPRGITLTPDRKQLWAVNQFGNSISILDAGTLRPVKTVTLDLPKRHDPALAGRYLFGSAAMTAGRQFSCNSCHPGGGSDGLVWEFVHVPDGLPARNTRLLQGGVPRTAPFRWSGREEDLDHFLTDEVTGLMHGAPPSAETLAALRRFLGALTPPANPHRADRGGLTEAGERGRVLFEGKAGCNSCHSGELRGGTGLKAAVGTVPDGGKLDVPHLAGVYDTAPYLHDGRAKSLEEVFARWNRQGKHGNTGALTGDEMTALLAYVRQL